MVNVLREFLLQGGFSGGKPTLKRRKCPVLHWMKKLRKNNLLYHYCNLWRSFMSFGFAYLVFVLKAVYEMLGKWKSSSQMCNLNQKSQSITMKKVQTHYHTEPYLLYWEKWANHRQHKGWHLLKNSSSKYRNWAKSS